MSECEVPWCPISNLHLTVQLQWPHECSGSGQNRLRSGLVLVLVTTSNAFARGLVPVCLTSFIVLEGDRVGFFKHQKQATSYRPL